MDVLWFKGKILIWESHCLGKVNQKSDLLYRNYSNPVWEIFTVFPNAGMDCYIWTWYCTLYRSKIVQCHNFDSGQWQIYISNLLQSPMFHLSPWFVYCYSLFNFPHEYVYTNHIILIYNKFYMPYVPGIWWNVRFHESHRHTKIVRFWSFCMKNGYVYTTVATQF